VREESCILELLFKSNKKKFGFRRIESEKIGSHADLPIAKPDVEGRSRIQLKPGTASLRLSSALSGEEKCSVFALMLVASTRRTRVFVVVVV